MKVKDAMHIGVEWVGPEMPIAQVAKCMKELDIGAIPVGDNDKLIGMVTDRDIACRGFANGKDVSTLTVRDVMSNGVIYCKDEEDIDDALRVMESNRVRRLPVINSKKAHGRHVEPWRHFTCCIA